MSIVQPPFTNVALKYRMRMDSPRQALEPRLPILKDVWAQAPVITCQPQLSSLSSRAQKDALTKANLDPAARATT